MPELFESEEQEGPKGLPGWMATFADMMALLMCFFVLLLAYSDMDVQKFKRIAGAMKEAFGVQNEINVEDIPKGTSAVYQEFSPGKPEPTPIRQIEQATVDSSQQYLQSGQKDEALHQAEEAARKQQAERNRQLLAYLKSQLSTELKDGVLELEVAGQQVIFRIREKGSFSSASAFLQPRFVPVVRKITHLVNEIPGQVIVAGHTDSRPVAEGLFENNWDLSAKRAVAVASQMARVSDFDTSRMTVSGHAANQPLVNANTIEARQKNRRVEIIVMQGQPLELDTLPTQQND